MVRSQAGLRAARKRERRVNLHFNKEEEKEAIRGENKVEKAVGSKNELRLRRTQGKSGAKKDFRCDTTRGALRHCGSQMASLH